MIVGEDDRGGIGGDGTSENFAGMDQQGVEGALCDAFLGDHSSTRIDQQQVERLDLEMPHVLPEEVGDPFRGVEQWHLVACLLAHAFGQLKCGLERDCLIQTDSVDFSKVGGSSCRKANEGMVKGVEEPLGHRGDGRGFGAGSQENRDQLRISESVGAESCQAFARALVSWRIPHQKAHPESVR